MHESILHRTERFAPLPQKDQVFQNQIIHDKTTCLRPPLTVRIVNCQRPSCLEPLRSFDLARRFRYGPQPIQQLVLVRPERISKNENLIRAGTEQLLVKILFLARINRQEGQTGPKLLRRIVPSLRVFLFEQRIGPMSIRLELNDDSGTWAISALSSAWTDLSAYVAFRWSMTRSRITQPVIVRRGQ